MAAFRLQAYLDSQRWALAELLQKALRDQKEPLRMHHSEGDFFIDHEGICPSDTAGRRLERVAWTEINWEDLGCIARNLS